MRSINSLVYPATLLSSFLCLNLQAIASNNIQGPFDIPLKNSNNSDAETAHRQLYNLRSGSLHERDGESSFEQLKPQQQIPRTPKDLDEARQLRTERMNDRRERAKQIIMNHQPEVGLLELYTHKK